MKKLSMCSQQKSGVDEEKLGIARDSFDDKTLVVNAGDKVNIKFTMLMKFKRETFIYHRGSLQS